MNKLPVLIVFAAVVAGTPSALADTETARTEFNDARRLFTEEKYEDAAAGFRRAYDADPNWKLLYNIGQCEAALKRHGLALEAFEAYLALGGDEVPGPRRDEIEKEVARLRGLVGFVTVNAPDSAIVEVAGAVRGTAPLPGPFPITAGVVQELRVTLNDSELLKRPIKISGGQSLTVDVPTGQQASAASGPQVAGDGAGPAEGSSEGAASGEPVRSGPVATKNKLVPVGIGLMVAGGAALIAGSITGAMALRTNDTLNDNCTGDACGPDQYDNVDKLNGLSMASTVLIPVGGAMLVTGTIILIIGKKKHNADQKASLQPLAAPGFAGITLKGAF